MLTSECNVAHALVLDPGLAVNPLFGSESPSSGAVHPADTADARGAFLDMGLSTVSLPDVQKSPSACKWHLCLSSYFFICYSVIYLLSE